MKVLMAHSVDGIWFMQERRKGTPINSLILKEKAKIFHSKLNYKGEFVASEGWLTRLKKSHSNQNNIFVEKNCLLTKQKQMVRKRSSKIS